MIAGVARPQVLVALLRHQTRREQPQNRYSILLSGGVGGRGSSWHDDSRRNPDSSRFGWDVGDDDGIGADPRMIANVDATEDLGAGADVDVPSNRGNAGNRAAGSESYSGQDEAVGSENRLGMNHDALRMQQHKPSAEFGAERNRSTADNRPEPVAENT